ncbi:MAG: hypothetical protein SO055_09325 [Sodaliphilus sp.]|nr:hypothetical protein [Sodaliphilus sp.]
MGGREVSRPYRVWFFAEGERFLSFWRCQCFAKRLFFMFLFQSPSIFPLNRNNSNNHHLKKSRSESVKLSER